MDILQPQGTLGGAESSSSQDARLYESETVPVFEHGVTETPDGLCATCEHDRRIERLCELPGHGEDFSDSESMSSISIDSRSKLCARCCRVQWHRAADVLLPSPVWAKFLFAVMETREELLASFCPVCQYIGSMMKPGYYPERRFLDVRCMCSLLTGQAHSQHHTKGYEHSPIFSIKSYDETDQDWVVEGVFGVLHPWSEHDQLAPRRVEPKYVDYMAVQQWLQACEDHHQDSCTSLDAQSIPGFKVIDCRTKSVVRLPQQRSRFVALSYVWGGLQVHPDGKFPRTIEDAITVCIALGFQYLWVDFYCINQQDVAEKQIQIQMMDSIYSQAQLTIVAAAGKDPTYGLPGVSSTARTPQQRLRLGDVELVQIYSSDEDVCESKWASRGWTFQEGFLSKRRLIFADKEVVYVCNRMYCQESIRQDLRPQSQGTSPILACDGFQGIFPMVSEYQRGRVDMSWLLAEYNQRDLSYPNDVLDACQGILNGLRISHLWGTPVKRTSWGNEELPSQGSHTLILYWRTEKPGRRREAFPTWSWTGWQGRKAFLDDDGDDGDYIDTCTISLMKSDGSNYTIDSLSSVEPAPFEHDASRCIVVTGLVCDIKRYIVDQAWLGSRMPGYKTYHKGPYAVFPYSETVDIFATLRLDEEGVGLDVLPDAVALTINKHKKQDFRRAMLVLVPHKGRYKRIGILECLHIGVFRDKRDWTESRKFLQRQDARFWMKTATMRTILIE